MEKHNAYYSVIQYCPDAGRDERGNVGVFLFDPSIPKAGYVIDRKSRRVAEFFGVKDKTQFSSLLNSFAERLKIEIGTRWTRQEWEEFIATRAIDIQMTPFRAVKIEDMDEAVWVLFGDLVLREPKGGE